MSDFQECAHLRGRKLQICRGEANLPLEGPNSINAYRRSWGMDPLTQAGTATEQKQPPPLLIRGWNFAVAMTRWTLAGMPRRSQDEIEERLAICQGCEHLVDNQCNQCGCLCVESNHLINKLALTTERCPVGKWE